MWIRAPLARVVVLGSLGATAGCDLVFGLEARVEPVRVHGRIVERYVTNGADFAPVVVERAYPPAEIALAVTLDDGSTPEVTYAEDGTFDFARDHEAQPYRFTITTDGTAREYQQDVPELVFTLPAAGRPALAPVQLSYVQFPYPGAPADSSALLPARIATTGIFTHSYTGQLGPTVTFDWRTAALTSNARPGSLDARAHDRVYALEYRTDSTSHPPTTYDVIRGVSSASFTQVANRVHTLDAPAPVVRNACAQLELHNASTLARLTSATGRTYFAVGGDWHVFAVPAREQLGLTAAMPIASVAAGANADGDTSVVATLHDPFPGWSLVAQAGAIATHDVTLPGTTTGARHHDVIRRYRSIEHEPLACTHAPTDMAAVAAIPFGVMLDGVALATDAQPVTLPEHDVEVTWQTTGDGIDDFVSISVYELVAADAFTTSRLHHVVSTTSDRVVLDRGLFVAGSAYIIAVGVVAGRPRAVDGDWSQLAPVIDAATTWSRYFVVQ